MKIKCNPFTGVLRFIKSTTELITVYFLEYEATIKMWLEEQNIKVESQFNCSL